jgi:DNA-damage-inducible protein J
MLENSRTIKDKGQIHVELSNTLKLEAESILKEMGLSVSEAVRIFLRQVVINREIPFDVRFTTNIPNKETKEAIAEIEANKNEEISYTEPKSLWENE